MSKLIVTVATRSAELALFLAAAVALAFLVLSIR
jgi:hypothetical protein